MISEEPEATPPAGVVEEDGGPSLIGSGFVMPIDGREVPVYPANRDYYYEGDQWGPARGTEDQIYGIQAGLIAAGLLSEGSTTPGFWNESTANAWKNVLELANVYSIDADEAFALVQANPDLAAARSRGSGSSGSGRRVRLTHPDDLKAVANQVAPDVIGRRLTEGEAQRFIESFQAMERGESAPNPQVAAETFAQQTDPTAAQGRDLVGVYGAFVNLLRGGGQNASA